MHADGICGQRRSEQRRGISSGQDTGESMKLWKWACVAGAACVCVILLAGKDDMIRYRRMRQM
jgi:hypothetical protein